MEMRAIMNGWTQEGMNGAQEAVHSEGWKCYFAQRERELPCGGKSLLECQRGRRLHLHFNKRQVFGSVKGMRYLELEQQLDLNYQGKMITLYGCDGSCPSS